MDPIKIDATMRSPTVDFDFVANRFRLHGESYPENVAEFYGPLLEKLDAHFAELRGADVRFEFELVYFNSSSAKVLMELFESLDEVAERGNAVTVLWAYEEGDENMQELGEEFAEDLEHAAFEVKVLPLE